jgi:UDP-N-acetylmuramoyl-L-alanyl-D-glutamate--2,6-diaminopimelate ligase
MVSLRRLLPDATFIGCSDIEVSCVSTDSRTVAPGQLFAAICGAHCDGHRFLADAVRRGAAAVLVERPAPELSEPQCVVPDTRVAYATLCHALAGNPAARLTVIGITGTNGKTTTAILTRSILQAAGHRVGLIGTIEQIDGVTSIPAALTTPGPDVLARLMRRMVDAGCSHAVMEVSSHALDQRRTAGITFDTAVFTNLTQDHLDYHRDIDAYRAAKARLFRERGPRAYAVLNADDPTSKLYAEECPGPIMRYAMRSVADFTAYDVRPSLDGSRFFVESCSGRCEIATPLTGEHNVYNLLAAAAVGRRYGIAWDVIRAGLEGVAAIPGRLERVRCGQPFGVLVDYAHTPGAIRSVLASLRRVCTGRILCLFGAGGDRDRTKRPLMAQAVEAAADAIVVTSDNPRSEDPRRIIREIVAGFRRRQPDEVEPDRRKAIELILAMARPGDCVLIAGKGHESYQIVGTQRLPFSDRAVAVEYLAKHYGSGGTEQEPEPNQRQRGPAAECAA